MTSTKIPAQPLCYLTTLCTIPTTPAHTPSSPPLPNSMNATPNQPPPDVEVTACIIFKKSNSPMPTCMPSSPTSHPHTSDPSNTWCQPQSQSSLHSTAGWQDSPTAIHYNWCWHCTSIQLHTTPWCQPQIQSSLHSTTRWQACPTAPHYETAAGLAHTSIHLTPHYAMTPSPPTMSSTVFPWYHTPRASQTNLNPALLNAHWHHPN